MSTKTITDSPDSNASIYEIIKKDIRSEYFQQNFPNDGQRFVAWYLRRVMLRDSITARDDITDGANDKQIDAVIVDDDERRIVIVQGKFIGRAAAGRLGTTARDIRGAGRASSRISKVFSAIATTNLNRSWRLYGEGLEGRIPR